MSGGWATSAIPAFAGLYQEGDGVGIDLRYAREAVNVETDGGTLAAAARCSLLRASLDAPIGTLARLHRRWAAEGEAREVLVAASGGALYWTTPEAEMWNAIALPAGWAGTAYASDRWSCVAYEMNEAGADPVDVLLLSNALDGMICLRGDTMTASAVETPKRFGVLARYAERIWGGAIASDPDMLVYSAPFDPFDWAQNADRPEDGAGDIQQPSWDGDGFSALVPLGAQLVALKRGRVWRILGTDPGQYAFREQYGGGALAARTVAVCGEGLLMLGADGVCRYDGLSVEPFGRAQARGVLRRMNRDALDGACACLWKDRYYLALPLDGARKNNAVLTYDLVGGAWLLREGVSVEAFLPTDEALFFTSAQRPGRVWRWGTDAFVSGAAAPCCWVSPWIDLGEKQSRKCGFTVRFFAEAQGRAEMKFILRTERGARERLCEVSGARPYALRFGGEGRRFRLEVESASEAPWRLTGGVQIEAEVIPD